MENLCFTVADPLGWLTGALQKWEFRGKFPSFTFREVSERETLNYINKLGNTTSYGINLIDAVTVKAAGALLAKPIRHMINVSFRSGRYANRWKLAKTIPLLKSSDLRRLNPASYRPVAILPTVSKIVERAAQCQLLHFLETTNQLNPSSHAYRTSYSTTTNLIEVTNKIYEAIDRNELVPVMTVDQSAAFDCIDHSILEK